VIDDTQVASSASAMTVAPLVFACTTCHSRFPHRYGWRSSVTKWSGPLWDEHEGFGGILLTIATIPVMVAFAAVWVPMEMMFPPCPMCGHGVVRRDNGNSRA
jgi:hypothetical protein